MEKELNQKQLLECLDLKRILFIEILEKYPNLPFIQRGKRKYYSLVQVVSFLQTHAAEALTISPDFKIEQVPTPTKKERLCDVEGCYNTHMARGYCRKHYNRYIKYGNALEPSKRRRTSDPVKTCNVDGCSNPSVCRNMCQKHYVRWKKDNLITPCQIPGCDKPVYALYLCSSHYNHYRRHGHPVDAKYQSCLVDDCTRKGKYEGYCKEHFTNLEVSGDPLLRRKPGPTAINTSGYKGVSWSKKSGKWRAELKVEGVLKYLGLYENKLDAAKAYNDAIDEYKDGAGFKNPVD